MGASNFYTEVPKSEAKTMSAAFDHAHSAAAYEHGHGGYTGTIAEKMGYHVAVLPKGWRAREFIAALAELPYADEYSKVDTSPANRNWVAETLAAVAKLRADVPERQLKEYSSAYEDKWGPALAIETETTWVFAGNASD